MSAATLRRLLELLSGHRALMAVSVSCRIVNLTLGVLIPAIAAGFVVGTVEGTAPGLGSIIWILVGLAVVKGLFRYLEQFTGHAVAFRLLADLRNQVFRWLERLEPARLESQRSGDLVARVAGDIARVEPFYAHTIAPVIAAVVVPLVSLVIMTPVAGVVPAIVLGACVALYLAIIPWLGRRRIEELGPEARRQAGESAAVVADVVQGANEIAILGAGPAVLDEVARFDVSVASTRAELARGSARRSLAGGLVAGLALLAVSWASVSFDTGAAGLVVSLVLAWTIMTPVRALEEIIPDAEQALAAAARLFELEDMEPQVTGRDHSRDDPRSIRFDHVLVVVDDRVLVDSVDLEIEPGSLVGIVGPSGSGKTTLVQTLVRHRDLDAGQLLLGGTPVADIAPPVARRQVALVPQRPDVFHGTLRSNLLVAKPEADDSEIAAALARARLLSWVEELERGLDTHIGERGVGMSGGQRQRLALARAFLRDPSILILDEATSELDSHTEAEVLREVFAERGRRTVIVVAHRMETILTADLIAVMDGGRLVERGSHDDLKAKGGLYAALWERHEDMLADV